MFSRVFSTKQSIFQARFFSSSTRFVVSQSGGLPDLMRFAAVDKRSFLPDGVDGISFGHPRECSNSPVLRDILEIKGITGAVVSKNFMSVYKDMDISWTDIAHRVEDILERAFEKNESVILPESGAVVRPEVDITEGITLSDLSDDDNDSDLDEINKDIEELLQMRAKPIVQGDGGDLEFRGFDEESGSVWIYFKGACESCSSSGVTLHQAIGQMLRHYIPEVTTIRRCDIDGEPLDDDGSPVDDYTGNPPALVQRKKAQKKLLREKLEEKEKLGGGLGQRFVNKK